jgi:hypothetical protein
VKALFCFKLFFFLIFSWESVSLFSQAGLYSGLYSGVHGIQVNPASQLFSSQPWRIDLASGFFQVDNNYAYLKNTSALGVFRNINGGIVPSKRIDPESANGDIEFDFFDNNVRKFVTGGATIGGPGFALRLNDQWSVGFFSNVKVLGTTRNLPSALGWYDYDRRPLFSPFEVDNFYFNTMAWSEVGLNVGYKYSLGNGDLGIGMNYRRLQGFQAGYFNISSPFNVTKIDNKDSELTSLNVEAGFTTTFVDDNFRASQGNFVQNDNIINGAGNGLDLGFTYGERDEEDSESFYKWTFGLAVTEIGSISFKENAEKHRFTAQRILLDDSELKNTENPISIVRGFSRQAFGDSLASRVSQRFSMWTPTTLRLSGTYNFTRNLHTSFRFHQALSTNKQAVSTPSLIQVLAGYDHKWYGFYMPVSLVGYSRIRLGLAAKMGIFTIGTDHFGSFVKNSELTGTNFFFGIHIDSFTISGLRFFRGEEGSSSYGKKRRGRVKCYKF